MPRRAGRVGRTRVSESCGRQSGAAIYKQLSDYRTGSRTNQLMTDIAKALDEATLADVAAYYAAQPKRNPDPTTLAESPPAIVHLVELGDPSRNIPPCAACHRPGSGGPIEAPILSEQGRDYLNCAGRCNRRAATSAAEAARSHRRVRGP